MAGSFLHLWLGKRLLVASGVDGIRQETAFWGGTLAPDMGFFPGGPVSFSQAVHHERTGDFVRTLTNAAQNASEAAFVLGWASHVYADAALHPYINQWAAAKAKETGLDPDLWHLRLEWGMDCLLLEEEDGQMVWHAEVEAPKSDGGGDILSRVAPGFYGDSVSPPLVAAGWAGMRRWMGRLPWIYLLSGGTRGYPGRRRWAWGGRIGRPLARCLARAFERGPRYRDAAAALAVWRPDPDMREELLRRGQEAMQHLLADRHNGFSGLANLDLDTGQEVA